MSDPTNDRQGQKPRSVPPATVSQEGGSDYVYVLSQIGEKGSDERKRADEVLDFIIKPVAEAKGLEVGRSDRDPTPGQVTTQIVRSIVQARVVIADLTGRNVNVYYELGVAHAFARPVLLLIDSTSSLPFDTQNERTISIGTTFPLGAGQARDSSQELERQLSFVLRPEYEPSSLVTEAASARSLDALAPTDPVASEIASIQERIDEIAGSMSNLLNWVRNTQNVVDLSTARAFIERNASLNRFSLGDLRSLHNDRTSGLFNSWVRELESKVEAGGGWDRRGGLLTDEEPF